MATDRLVIGGHSYDKVHLIVNADASNAGFCALMTYALNGVRRARQHNWLPVVQFDSLNCPFFHERAFGEDVWDYYFEPVAGVSYAQVQAWLASGELSPDRIHTYHWRDLLDWHHSDPERIATFWAADVPADPAAWMTEKRALGRRFAGEYLRVKPHIAAKVDDFVAQRMRGRYTFGAHVRGTDFAYAEPTPPEAYFRAIEDLARRGGIGDYQVFLATDQQQFVELFRRQYGERLLTYDALRSSGEVAPFRMSGTSPYKKGEDVLIDTLVMSRCNYLLKGAAAGGEYALWFNADLECVDFGLRSRFDTRDYHLLESAYLKLNPDKASPWRLRLRRAAGVVVQYVRASAAATFLRRTRAFLQQMTARPVR